MYLGEYYSCIRSRRPGVYYSGNFFELKKAPQKDILPNFLLLHILTLHFRLIPRIFGTSHFSKICSFFGWISRLFCLDFPLLGVAGGVCYLGSLSPGPGGGYIIWEGFQKRHAAPLAVISYPPRSLPGARTGRRLRLESLLQARPRMLSPGLVIADLSGELAGGGRECV